MPRRAWDTEQELDYILKIGECHESDRVSRFTKNEMVAGYLAGLEQREVMDGMDKAVLVAAALCELGPVGRC